MGIVETTNRIFSDGFKAVSISAEIKPNYTLFRTKFNSAQAEQIKILTKLGKDLPFFSGKSFEDKVHFQNAQQTPVQRWFPYREGYSIKLVDAFIKEFKIRGNIFDPFVGSGTTLLASRANDLNSFGIDVNPVSVFVARVENEQYTDEDIIQLEEEIGVFAKLKKSKEVFHTTFPLADKVFNYEILQALLQSKEHIKCINKEKVKSIFFLAWLSIIENVSNIKKEGNGIKYKNRKRTPNGYIIVERKKWEEENFPADKHDFVKSKLLHQLSNILSDLKLNYGRCNKRPNIYHGSCLEFDSFIEDEFELTFFSPPYCNCFDYFEIHKVELWLGDFISNKEELRELRNASFRSHANSSKDKPIVYKNEYLERLLSLFEPKKLWNSRIPQIVRGYFDDIYTLLSKLYGQTTKNGYVVVVVGNSAYSGIVIPTDIFIAEIAKEIGFKVKNIIVTRHLTTSSQQKRELEPLKNYLRESIVLVEK